MDTLHIVYILTAVLAALNLFDWYSTRTILKAGGTEANPVMAKLFSIFGIDVTLAAKVSAVTTVGCFIGVMPQGLLLLGAFCALYVYVAYHNYTQLPK